ncbi:MAG: methyltransferase [Coriobacteriia bacterium]|nr:methyltransferase [Coriobacteriia bacterium]
MSIDPVMDHMGNWWAVVLWVLLFGVFLLFAPFYKKSGVKPNGAFMAFVVALALEMFGVPLSMYALGALLGRYMPDGVLWGHTLVGYIGLAGTQVAIVLYLTSLALVFAGWRAIYRDYWSKGRGEGKLVTSGIYRFIRHPQYTGFALATLGMLVEWATLPTLIMWPILMTIYYRLARREESEMREEFGVAYDEYAARTGMFLPTRVFRPAARRVVAPQGDHGA